MKKTVQILNGPSREELFDGLRLIVEKRQVSFIFFDSLLNNKKQLTVNVRIHSIEAEDGSGYSWNIKFSISDSAVLSSFMLAFVNVTNLTFTFNATSTMFKAYYSTRKRTGVIILE